MRILLISLVSILVCSVCSVWADTWTELTPSTSPGVRWGHSMVKYNGVAYIFGGKSTRNNSVSRREDLFYDLWKWSDAKKQWEEEDAANQPPEGRYSHSAAVSGDKMYVFYGINATGVASGIYSYDFTTREWQLVTPGGQGPMPRYAHTSVTLNNGNILVFGGITHQGLADGHMWLYDPQNNTWTQKASNPESSYYGHSSVVYDNLAMIFGGNNLNTSSDKMWAYNLDNDQWNSFAFTNPGPSARAFHGSAVIENKLWIYGGNNIDTDKFQDNWELDFSTGKWTQKANLPMQMTGSRAVGFADEKYPKVLTFAGKSENQVNNKTHMYYPEQAPITVRYVEPLGECGGLTPCYSTIQAAIDNAVTGSAILVKQGIYAESLSLGTNKTLLIKGGYNDAYNQQTDNTTFIQASGHTTAITITAFSGSVKLKAINLKCRDDPTDSVE